MVRKIILPLSFVFTLLFLTNSYVHSQDKWWKEKRYKNDAARQKHDLCKKTFKDIWYGFQNKNVNFITEYFKSQVYLNLISGENGYYSTNQAELLLINFMDFYTIDSIRYIKSNKYNSFAYANGIYTYITGSRKYDMRFTISLEYDGSKWLIDQIKIY
ncbi:MAG TPA: DUF4783 domain-containing protein [Ignavibacteria bacterium]|nr:DUF4783 domain-containing protein [Ignavibacteria bacterium]